MINSGTRLARHDIIFIITFPTYNHRSSHYLMFLTRGSLIPFLLYALINPICFQDGYAREPLINVIKCEVGCPTIEKSDSGKAGRPSPRVLIIG